MDLHPTRFIGGKDITYCEFRIIQQATKGLLRKEIAAALGKSPDTIDSQMRYLYKKLEIESINDLILWAIDNGFDREGNYTPKVLVIPAPTPPTKKKKSNKKKKKVK